MRKREITMTKTFVNPLDYAGHSISIEQWTDPPQMSTGAPSPELTLVRDVLFVAYYRGDLEDPGFEVGIDASHPFSILRFDGVHEHYIGPPNDEALHLHPLFSKGLSYYKFYRVNGSPKASKSHQHWILTFHDETVEIIAVAGSVAYKSTWQDNMSSNTVIKSLAASLGIKDR